MGFVLRSVSTFGSCFLQSDNAVEDQASTGSLRLRFLVNTEVSNTLELEAVKFFRIGLHVPQASVLIDDERVLVEVLQPVFALFLGGEGNVFDRE